MADMFIHHQSEVVFHMEEKVDGGASELFHRALNPPMLKGSHDGTVHAVEDNDHTRSSLSSTNDSTIPASIIEIFESIPVRQFRLDIGSGDVSAVPSQHGSHGLVLSALIDDQSVNQVMHSSPVAIPISVLVAFRKLVHHIAAVVGVPSMELISEENITIGGDFRVEGLEINSRHWMNEKHSSRTIIPQRPWAVSSQASDASLCRPCLKAFADLLPCRGVAGLEAAIGDNLVDSVFLGVTLEVGMNHSLNGHSKNITMKLTRKIHQQVPVADLSAPLLVPSLFNSTTVPWLTNSKTRGSVCPFYDNSILHLSLPHSIERMDARLVSGSDGEPVATFAELLVDPKGPSLRSFSLNMLPNDADVADITVSQNDPYRLENITVGDLIKSSKHHKVAAEIAVHKEEIPVNLNTGLESILRWKFRNTSDVETKVVMFEEAVHPLFDPLWSTFKVTSTRRANLSDDISRVFFGKQAMRAVGLGTSGRSLVAGIDHIQSGYKPTDFNVYFKIPPAGEISVEFHIRKTILNISRNIQVLDKGDYAGLGRLHYVPRRTFMPRDLDVCVLTDEQERDYFHGYRIIPDILIRTPSPDITFTFKTLSLGFAATLLIASQTQRLVFATEKASVQDQVPLGIRLIKAIGEGFRKLKTVVKKKDP
eukprot:GHVH01006365.1.p1 GENE.GHVH01006365.1~~GHVH01006365.1.p1  ORF type:complete len:720 (+),score=77.09 GHVH01006365.1:212-2161(+)